MKNTKLLILDVDGTLTDGKIYMGQTGEAVKCFDVKDGCGIKDILPLYGIEPVIITGRSSKIVENRCKELEISKLYQGVGDKEKVLNEILSELAIEYSQVAYIGDDINDLSCMLKVKENGGKVGCPKDAVHKVIEVADYVSSKNGGDGAVREFIEWIIE